MNSRSRFSRFSRPRVRVFSVPYGYASPRTYPYPYAVPQPYPVAVPVPVAVQPPMEMPAEAAQEMQPQPSMPVRAALRTIDGQAIRLRESPSIYAGEMGVYTNDQVVQVLETGIRRRSEDINAPETVVEWWRVQTPDGRSGYMRRAEMVPIGDGGPVEDATSGWAYDAFGQVRPVKQIGRRRNVYRPGDYTIAHPQQTSLPPQWGGGYQLHWNWPDGMGQSQGVKQIVPAGKRIGTRRPSPSSLGSYGNAHTARNFAQSAAIAAMEGKDPQIVRSLEARAIALGAARVNRPATCNVAEGCAVFDSQTWDARRDDRVGQSEGYRQKFLHRGAPVTVLWIVTDSWPSPTGEPVQRRAALVLAPYGSYDERFVTFARPPMAPAPNPTPPPSVGQALSPQTNLFWADADHLIIAPPSGGAGGGVY